MRRVYSDRSVLVMQDLQDQPEGRYVAFVEGMLGEKAAITCDGVGAGPDIVSFFREVPDLDIASQGKKKGVAVASVSKDVRWVMVERERLIRLSGAEYEQARVDDAQDRERLLKQHFGTEGVVRVVTLPDGSQVAVPATTEAKEKFLEKQNEPVLAPLGDYL